MENRYLVQFNFYLFYSSTIISFYLQLFLIFLCLLSHFISLSSFYLTFYYFINNVKRLEIIVSFNNLIKRLTNKLYYVTVALPKAGFRSGASFVSKPEHTRRAVCL